MKYLTAICLVLLTTGCGSSNSSRTGGYDYVPAESGAGGAEPVGTGGQTETGGINGIVPGTGGVEPIGTGGNVDSTGGTDAGGTDAGGTDAGGAGNTGPECQPWNCTNLAIDRFGWDSNSGEPVPEICGLVQDPCTGQYIECGGCTGTTLITGEAVLTHHCGVTTPNTENYPFVFDPGVADVNSCNVHCMQYGDMATGGCLELRFLCSIDNLPPSPLCVPQEPYSPNEAHDWCCPSYDRW